MCSRETGNADTETERSRPALFEKGGQLPITAPWFPKFNGPLAAGHLLPDGTNCSQSRLAKSRKAERLRLPYRGVEIRDCDPDGT